MFSHFQINVTMEFYKSTCDFILRETTTTKTKKRGKKKEEKPLVIYLQVRTSWNDKQIFKSTGKKYSLPCGVQETNAPYLRNLKSRRRAIWN